MARFMGMLQKKYIVISALIFLLLPYSTALGNTCIKMSYNGAPTIKDNPVHVFAIHFKYTIEQKTHGNVTIELYPDSQLGNEQQRMQQVINEPMINVASFGGMETIFPELFVTNIPFLFDSYKAAHIFFDSSTTMQELRNSFLKRTGVQLLEVIEEGGFIAFTSTEPIKSPKDFKGQQFRAMDASQIAMYKAFGATGIPVPWTSVYTALESGMVDGQMNPPTYIILEKLYEVQQFLTLANVQYSNQFLLINDSALQQLSKKEQKIVKNAAQQANSVTRMFVESQVAKRIYFLEKKGGMTVYRPSPEEMEDFKRISTPSYLAWLRQQVPAKLIDQTIHDAQKANHSAQ